MPYFLIINSCLPLLHAKCCVILFHLRAQTTTNLLFPIVDECYTVSNHIQTSKSEYEWNLNDFIFIGLARPRTTAIDTRTVCFWIMWFSLHKFVEQNCWQNRLSAIFTRNRELEDCNRTFFCLFFVLFSPMIISCYWCECAFFLCVILFQL